MSRTSNYEDIKKYFLSQDQEKIARGQLPMRSTQVGFWGVSNLDDVKEFFERMQFAPKTKFLDIGCGDGRVVAVASHYVQATGVEYDHELARIGQQAVKELRVGAEIICGDALEVDFSDYDVLYAYADRNFLYLKEKLLRELNGTLYLYHDTYHPDFLVKEKTVWVGQIPIFAYTAPTRKE